MKLMGNVQKLWLIQKLIKSRSLSKVMFGNKNQKERDRDETKNYYNTSV